MEEILDAREDCERVSAAWSDDSGLIEHARVELRGARVVIAHRYQEDDVQFSRSGEYCTICESSHS